MPRTDLNDLVAFLAVAQERSFTRAAAQLGVSQSALSQTLRRFCQFSRQRASPAPSGAGTHPIRPPP